MRSFVICRRRMLRDSGCESDQNWRGVFRTVVRSELRAASTALQRKRHVAEAVPTPGQRVVVRSNDNFALIRSGQEWTQTSGKERDLYLREVEPVLREGMDFLRDQGLTIGCYSNRCMQLVDGSGRTLEKSFVSGLSSHS
jgi:Haem-containing dehydratase